MTEELKDKRWIDKIYMLHENELWLNEQAGKGRILKKFDKVSVGQRTSYK